MSQVSIKVDPGTGSPVDFSSTANANYRQVVALGDPTTDANYATVDASGNLQVTNTGGTITSVTNLNAGTITTVSAVTNLNQGTITTVQAVSNLNQGTITTVQTIQNLNQGTITTISNLLAGTIVAHLNAPRGIVFSSYTSIATNLESTLIAAAGANIFTDVASIIIANTGGTAVTVDIRDVTAGAIINSFTVPSLETRGGVFVVPWPQTTANSSWTVQLSTTVTAKIAAEYIKNK